MPAVIRCFYRRRLAAENTAAQTERLCTELFSNRCAYGASICTSAAINALLGIDNVLAVSFGDRFNGATVSASAATETFVGNFVSHDITSIID